MKRVLVIGIGIGDPDHLTVAAVNALNQVDVVFVVDKGDEVADLVRVREEICRRHLTAKPYRVVTIPDAKRDRDATEYRDAVDSWHEARAQRYAHAIDTELAADGCGAFLVWGDPSLYDSTLRVLERARRHTTAPFDHEVVPGLSSLQLLAARHRLVLNDVGTSVLVTTGRLLAQRGFPADVDDVVVMLDGSCAWRTVDPEGVEIYWGANLGGAGEAIAAGPLATAGPEIERRRAEVRARCGWVLDIYLLRRRRPGEPAAQLS
jgi:precorrin-6A synthase